MSTTVFYRRQRRKWVAEARYHGNIRTRSFPTEEAAHEAAPRILAEVVREVEGAARPSVASGVPKPSSARAKRAPNGRSVAYHDLFEPALQWLMTEGRPKARGRRGPISARTAYGYRKDLTLLAKREGPFVKSQVCSVTAARLGEVEDRMCRSRGPSARQNLRAAVSGVFAYSIKLGLRPDNPCDLLPRIDLKPQEQHRTRLKPQEKARYVSAAVERGDLEGIALIVALTSGLRPGDVLGLREQDVELRDSKLRVSCSFDSTPAGVGQRLGPTKGRTILPTPLHPEVAPLLAALLTGEPGARMFPFRYERLRDAHLAVMKRAGIERRVTPHNLRTTAISEAMDDGKIAPMRVSKVIARHASFETTERYYTLIQEEEAAEQAAPMLRPLGLATPLRPKVTKVTDQ